MRDWQDDGAPTVQVLWDDTHTARRPHLCDCCNEPIEIGARYRNSGWLEDGQFRSEKSHWGAYSYPSGCPRFADRDRKELADQFEADRERYFPADHDASDGAPMRQGNPATDEHLPPIREGQ